MTPILHNYYIHKGEDEGQLIYIFRNYQNIPLYLLAFEKDPHLHNSFACSIDFNLEDKEGYQFTMAKYPNHFFVWADENHITETIGELTINNLIVDLQNEIL